MYKSTTIRSQAGFAHSLLLVGLLLVVGVSAVGYRVYTASSADTLSVTGVTDVSSVTGVTAVSSPSTRKCGTLRIKSQVFAIGVGTKSAFSNAVDNDSVRNLAYALCQNSYLTLQQGQTLNKSGTTTPTLKQAFLKYETNAQVKGVVVDGVPDYASIVGLKLTPVGFPAT